MKRILIVSQVCLNAALLVTLILGTGVQNAPGQVFGGGTDYMVITGRIDNSYDAIYIIDVGKQRIASWKFDKKRKRLLQFGTVRELTQDFRP